MRAAGKGCGCQILPSNHTLGGVNTTMNVSLPASLKSFVDEQVTGRGYGTCSEYVRALIRRDQERQHLRRLLLEGAESAVSQPVDAAYFEESRAATAVSPRRTALS